MEHDAPGRNQRAVRPLQDFTNMGVQPRQNIGLENGLTVFSVKDQMKVQGGL